MKVLHILNELKFSGAEIMYVDAAPLFQELKCDLSVINTTNNLGEFAPFFKKAGYKVIHNPYPTKNIIQKLLYLIHFRKYIKENNFDIIHIHRHNMMFLISFCAWSTGKRSIYTFHNVFPSKRFTYLYHILQRIFVKKIFRCKFQTISDSVYNHELKYYLNNTTKIYNWYSNKRYYPASFEEKINIRKELNISENANVIISVGGCSHIKRHSDILKAFKIVLNENKNSIYLHLGKGEVEDEEIKLAKELNIENNVRFLGNQSEVRKYLVASDIYIMSSKHEGIPITTIEAMGCKIPAILYNVPGLKDFNISGNNCLLIPEDSAILAEKIIYLINNPSISNNLALNAKLFIDTKFSLEKNARQIVSLYNEI
ncbi:MAG: hypothetical protein BGO29_09395 [Bacteroidales bacterium 36-12]|nr:MAG: hypothetical protein BGO29_09395 [Bacteroidales bacterium 36-12]